MSDRHVAEAAGSTEGLDDHVLCMHTVIAAMKLLDVVDLAGALEKAQRALDFGPLIHPSEWIAKHEALEHDVEVLRAALPLWRLAKAMRAEMKTRSEKL